MEIANKYTERLPELKKTVEDAYEYFKPNIETYEQFTKFVFKTSISNQEAQALSDLEKPVLEFNILEALISKLRGEFAKQEPSLTVRAADGLPSSMLTPQFSEQLSLTEAHLRAIFFDGSNDMLEYNIYSDLLAGGFSVMRVYTEYINERSFEQNIYVERVFDPTLTIFDPLARQSHKGDGRFCGELYPMSKQKFIEEYGEEAAKDMKFSRTLSGFNWSFKNEAEEVVLICDFFEKKKKKVKIYLCSDGKSRTKKEYEDYLEDWESQGNIEQPPVVVKERDTKIESIYRYRFCESKILNVKETSFKHLPLVFVDGNSVFLKDNGAYSQFTRPYVYHARDLQKLKNFAGQTLASELESIVTHKFKIAIESVPRGYEDAYKDVQHTNTLLYHAFNPNDPTQPLPPPQEIQRAPIPAEVPATFVNADQMLQSILGSYDTSQIDNAKMSGIAFARSAIQSNNASVPYIVGFIKGLNRVAQIIVDLIPKYYRTPRSLPVLLPDGKRDYVPINQKGSIFMNFDPTSLDVKVETGINFAMQKELAMQTVINLSQANESFGQFFNQEGLPIILDNLDIRGIDQLKEKANKWMAQQQQQAQAQQQAQQQQMQMEMQKQQMEMAALQKQIQSPTEGEVGAELVRAKAQNDAANVAIKAQDSETKRIETLSKIQAQGVENELKAAEVQAENLRSQVEMATKLGQTISKDLEDENG
jgi:hypothetical protein